MREKRFTAHEKRLALNGLQSDEFRLSMSSPSWEKVRAGFTSADTLEAAGSELRGPVRPNGSRRQSSADK